MSVGYETKQKNSNDNCTMVLQTSHMNLNGSFTEYNLRNKLGKYILQACCEQYVYAGVYLTTHNSEN